RQLLPDWTREHTITIGGTYFLFISALAIALYLVVHLALLLIPQNGAAIVGALRTRYERHQVFYNMLVFLLMFILVYMFPMWIPVPKGGRVVKADSGSKV